MTIKILEHINNPVEVRQKTKELSRLCKTLKAQNTYKGLPEQQILDIVTLEVLTAFPDLNKYEIFNKILKSLRMRISFKGQRLVILLVGVPGSGKSTYAKRFTAPKTSIISTDTIREKLYGSEKTLGDFSEVRAEMVKQTDQAWCTKQTIIFDATHIKPEWRQNTLDLVQHKPDFQPRHACVHWVKNPLEVCLERNMGRERKVPNDVIHRMYEDLEKTPPQMCEGFSRVKIVRN